MSKSFPFHRGQCDFTDYGTPNLVPKTRLESRLRPKVRREMKSLFCSPSGRGASLSLCDFVASGCRQLGLHATTTRNDKEGSWDLLPSPKTRKMKTTPLLVSLNQWISVVNSRHPSAEKSRWSSQTFTPRQHRSQTSPCPPQGHGSREGCVDESPTPRQGQIHFTKHHERTPGVKFRY